MTAKANITVAIEPGLLKRARAVAARRGQSVSALRKAELANPITAFPDNRRREADQVERR
jgi:hypothetical protein